MESSASENSLDSSDEFKDPNEANSSIDLPPLLGRHDEASEPPPLLDEEMMPSVADVPTDDKIMPTGVKTDEEVPANDHDHNCAKCGKSTNTTEKRDFQSAGGNKRSDNDQLDWILCESCHSWFHIDCVDLEEFECKLIEKYSCPSCTKTIGPSIMKVIKVPHRYDFSNEQEAEMDIQIGTKPWIDKFAEYEKEIPPCEDLKIYQTGGEFMAHFEADKEWISPLKVLDPTGLGMELPDKSFDMEKLMEIVGSEKEIETIDVYMQLSSRMSMGKFYEKWLDKRERLYNMLSFEFSHTELKKLIKAPKIMYDLSWVHKYWPDDENEKNDILHEDHVDIKPDVAMFCLLGMGGSYTDFHIDFGGSSVWYHVFQGEKVFYVMEPTEQNLRKFAEWSDSPRRSELFLNNMIDGKPLRRIVIKQGETLMIPSGWIHAVYTPIDSMVFGGNFIHDLNIKRQLQVYEIEQKCKFDENFLFPMFELTNRYAALDAVEKIDSIVNSLSPAVIEGYRAMVPHLQIWEERDKKNGLGVHGNFVCLVKRLKEALKQYDKSLAEENYEPDAKKKKSNSPGSIMYGKQKKHKEDKLKKLPKKDGQYVKKMFSQPSRSGRQLKPASWVQESVPINSQPGPSSMNNNFMSNFSPEERELMENVHKIDEKHAQRWGGAEIYSDDDITANNGQHQKKLKKTTKTPRMPKQSPPKKSTSTTQQRMASKLKNLKKIR